MSLTGTRTFVGFGFGAIQSGLFLYESFRSGAFGRLVVAEVLPDVVNAIRQADRHFIVNIAHTDRIEQARIGPIEIENPAEAADRERLIEAIAQAHELATAIPSVKYYVSNGSGSLDRVLAAGLRRKAARQEPPAVIYTAENNNHAAEILQEQVLAHIPAAERDSVLAKVRFLNTVIGKMSGIKTDPAEIAALQLARVVPGSDRAFLVETFNRILISKIAFEAGAFERGITVFEEKNNLLPFEEAKLYGHNATHALAAYLGARLGVQYIADLVTAPGAMAFLRQAFIQESGAALVQKYNGMDPLFTPAGYQAYADDLLARMTNPLLQDSVERVGRDPQRKLGWNDRLIGTIRLALGQGIEPARFAFGAAAALGELDPALLEPNAPLGAVLEPLWEPAVPNPAEQAQVTQLITAARLRLRQWLEAGSPNLA